MRRWLPGLTALTELQDKLYAQDRWAVLLIFKAMDAAGKDGAIKHVMSGVNPQGCQVFSFKPPSAEDLDHDYLWRRMKCLPNRGHIFNRSYYEEVLVVRVHPEFMKFFSNDAAERDFWNDYRKAYEEMIQQTATKKAPWYVVPADNKWFTRVVVAAAVIETLADLDLAYPKVSEAKLKELAAAKNKLLKK